jgi:molybdate transport system substrate-binding protein
MDKRRRKLGAFSFGLFIAFAAFTVTAKGADLRVCTIRAGMTVLAQIAPELERSTGQKITIVYDPAVFCAARIAAGEPLDVVIGNSTNADLLVKEGKILPDTRTNLAYNAMGVEVRAGSPKPDITSVDAFKRTLLNAKSVGFFPRPGVPELIDRLGLTDVIKSKVVLPNSDVVSDLVAKGDLELGIVFITQILTTPGVEFVGPLPAEVQYKFQLTASVTTTSKVPDAAKELIKFLTTPAVVQIFKAQGMEPN